MFKPKEATTIELGEWYKRMQEEKAAIQEYRRRLRENPSPKEETKPHKPQVMGCAK